MSDFKFPVDGTEDGVTSLILDEDVNVPVNKLESNSGSITFEVCVFGATALDTNVEFKFFSSLSVAGLDAPNAAERVTKVQLTGLTGDLVFIRDFVDSAHSHYRVRVSGTSSSSTATYLINCRSN